MNIDKYRNKEGKLWLNVASSVYVLEDFVNLDNSIFLFFVQYLDVFKWLVPSKYSKMLQSYRDARKKALIVRHDCRAALDFPDSSVDHILCSHFLEHVYPDEAEAILVDFYRALKPGGTMHIIVPDIRRQVDKYLSPEQESNENAADEFIRETLLSKESRGSLKYRILEFSGGFGLQHRWMYDSKSMGRRIRDAGFVLLDDNATPSREYRKDDGHVHVVARK